MVDKTAFMETLHSVQEIAKASPVPLTKEEIRDYFQGMDLSEEQQEMIYQFLLTPQEEVLENEDDKEAANTQAEAKSYKRTRPKPDVKPAGQSQNPHFQMYLSEISSVAVLTKEQQTALYHKLLSGEKTAIEEISHQWLKKIIEIAGEFVTPRVFLEDIVQEGNIALLLGLGQLLGKVHVRHFSKAAHFLLRHIAVSIGNVPIHCVREQEHILGGHANGAAQSLQIIHTYRQAVNFHCA